MMLVCVLHQQSQLLTVPTIGTVYSVWLLLLLVYGKVCFVTCPCYGHFNLQSHSCRVTCLSTYLYLFVLKHVRGCRKIRSNFDVGVLSALYSAPLRLALARPLGFLPVDTQPTHGILSLCRGVASLGSPGNQLKPGPLGLQGWFPSPKSSNPKQSIAKLSIAKQSKSKHGKAQLSNEKQG